MIFHLFTGLLFILYGILLIKVSVSFNTRFKSLKSQNIQNNTELSFSIIIAYRNEASNLPLLIDSIDNISYKQELYEVIFVNDHSSDISNSIITDYIAKNTKSNWYSFENDAQKNGKKAALTVGINQASKNYIITTDADCIVPSNWLNIFNKHIQQTQNEFVAGPVVYQQKQGLLNNYQTTENAGLIAIGALGFATNKPFMANGANLCFSKEGFFSLNGYEGNEHIASGDDEFLLAKFFKRNNNSVSFLYNNEAVVTTQPQPNFKDFIQQRIRWASKGKLNTRGRIFYFQLLTFLFCTAIISHLIIGTFIHTFFIAGLVYIFCKILLDYLFMRSVKSFFNIRIQPTSSALCSLLQLVIIPYIGLLSFGKTYEWKGREHKI